MLDMQTVQAASEVDRVISATVKALYSGRGLTADDVAKAIGVSHGTISSRINGHTSWTAREVRAAADFFNVRIGDLYGGFDGMFPGVTPARLPRVDSNHEPAGNVPLRRLALLAAA